MSDKINHDRRRFFGTAAVIFAAAQFALNGSANAQTESKKTLNSRNFKPETNTSFASLKYIDAGLLNVGYAEAGPADGPPVILLHGWPYDIHSFVDVAPLLASAGFRVIVPYVRGYGTTRFLSPDAFRNGQPSALAVDLIALMDALRIEKAILAGFDWGARTADIAAALWPERVKALVSVSGYLIGSQQAGKMPLPPKAELQWWYQFYFATERGRVGYDKYRRDFAKLIWQLASPKWQFDDATFDRSAAAFDHATEAMRARLLAGQVAPADIQRLSAAPVAQEGVRSSSMGHVLAAIERIHPAQGQGCLVFATSHGAFKDGLVLVPSRDFLTPAALDRALLRGCGDAPTVAIISGCFSGSFTKAPMNRANRAILTAAREDRPSFGCGAGFEYTVYDRCLLSAMDQAATWRSAYTMIRTCVAEREQELGFRPSEPQAWFGAAVMGLPVPR